MRCSVLASGSTGNAIYVETDHTRILLDAGIGLRQLQQAFAAIEVDPATLDAILVTHEHSDHIKGLAALLRKYDTPIYTSDGTWAHIVRLFSEKQEVKPRSIKAGIPFSLGEFVIEPFALPHDAEEPLGFCVYAQGEKLVLATDLGYASERICTVARGAHTLILESNHDIDMLRTGTYPWHLKRRILGDKGHLSNAAAGECLLDIVTEDTQTVYLAHLSQENNRPEIAKETVATMLSRDVSRTEAIVLRSTSPTAPTALAPVCVAR